MTKKIQQQIDIFLKDTKTNLKEDGVNIYFGKGEHVNIDSIRTAGYWSDEDSNNLKLAVATGKPYMEWISIYAHEYCHYLQWKEKIDIWVENSKFKEDYQILYITTKDEKYYDLFAEQTLALQKLEIDCEKRTVRLLKKYKLLDILGGKDSYIKQSNAYIYFYTYMLNYKKWYPATNPWAVKSIIDIMPARWLSSYNPMPKKIFNQYLKTYPMKG